MLKILRQCATIQITVKNEADVMVFDQSCGVDAASTGLDDLTLTPSINLDTEEMRPYPEACKWHGFVTNGVAA